MYMRLFFFLTLIGLPQLAPAQSYDDLARVTLLPGWRTAEGDHIAALQISLRPGWLTYWRAPGDAGIPPQFLFTGSDQIISITPHWPTPQVFGPAGMRSIGYYDQVIVPLQLALSPGAAAVSVQGEVEIGVCAEICIPVTVPFAALLTPEKRIDNRIIAALAAGPVPAHQAGVGVVTCRVEPISDGLRVTADIALPSDGNREYVIFEAADPRIWVSEADVLRQGNRLSATVDMVHPSGQPFALDRSGIRMTILGGARGVDIQGCAAG